MGKPWPASAVVGPGNAFCGMCRDWMRDEIGGARQVPMDPASAHQAPEDGPSEPLASVLAGWLLCSMQ